jgi:alcohol dehydrogenase class IV
MAIVQSINSVHQFREAFRLAGRMDQFSYEGLEVLFDYLDNLSEDTGEPIELDPAALCCEYYESSIEEIIDRYNLDVSYVEGDEDEIKEMVREYLEYRTSVCGEVCGGFVYAAF